MLRTQLDREKLQMACERLEPESSEKHLMQTMLKDIDMSDTGHIYEIDDEGEIVGALAYYQTQDEDLNISSIVVMPLQQSRGIGSRLIEAAKELAKTLKKKRLELYSLTESIGFYEKMGFEVDGKICRLNI